jgi:hypothetical protein
MVPTDREEPGSVTFTAAEVEHLRGLVKYLARGWVGGNGANGTGNAGLFANAQGFFHLAPEQKQPAKTSNNPVVVYLSDGSKVYGILQESFLPFKTPYGELKIPVEQIQTLELTMELSSEHKLTVMNLIRNLGHEDFKVREEATEGLKQFGFRAYPTLLKSLKDPDPEVVRRSGDLVSYFKTNHQKQLESLREDDLLTTSKMRVEGKVSKTTLQFHNEAFGTQSLKIGNIQKILEVKHEHQFNQEVAPAPTNLSTYANQLGKVLHLRVTGSQQGSIWGSGPYTLDSSVAVSAVHAGLVGVGETKVLRVKVVASPLNFTGTTQNGVMSAPYGQFTSGAFEFLP